MSGLKIKIRLRLRDWWRLEINLLRRQTSTDNTSVGYANRFREKKDNDVISPLLASGSFFSVDTAIRYCGACGSDLAMSCIVECDGYPKRNGRISRPERIRGLAQSHASRNTLIPRWDCLCDPSRRITNILHCYSRRIVEWTD